VINLFSGFDPREEFGYHTFVSSVIHHASEPVSITPLDQRMLRKVYGAGDRDGSNQFIYTRFLVPYLMRYRDFAIFADGADMLCRGDIAELWALRDVYKAAQVVKHDYTTKHPIKYIDTQMEAGNDDYPRKNWSSLMLINCAHYAWRQITPETVETRSGADLHRLSFIEDRFIGELPKEWNWLCQEYGDNNAAKLLHYSVGIPGFPHYSASPHADDWAAAATKVTHVTP
jgi:hypothetical protein